MILYKCTSVLLSTIMLMNSGLLWANLSNSNNFKEDRVTPIVETVHETTIEETDIEVISEEVYEEPIIETEEQITPEISNGLPLSDEEIDLIALVTMAEAEGESEEGKRLVIDVILNRLDSPRFSNTVDGVIYAKNAFECLVNGRADRCYVRDDIRQLVIEELKSRTNSNIHYFRADHYHNFGTPVVHVGNHYFSTY